MATHQFKVQEPFRALFYAPFYAALARGDTLPSDADSVADEQVP